MSFLPVVGYEDSYEVSEFGEVRSVDRIVLGKDGINYPFKGRILKPNPNKNVEYLQLSLWKNGIGISYYVHILVAKAHIPNPLNLPEVNHKNGIRVYNYKSNLEWVTSQQNSIHAIETGLLVYTNRLTKDEFIQCLFDVINGESFMNLSNRVPYKVPFLSTKIRKYAQELGLENELNESIYEQRVERARINGASHK